MQSIRIANGRLYVGSPSTFRVWDLSVDGPPQHQSLVNLEDASMQFLNASNHDAQMCVSVHGDEDPREFLLVFDRLGIYVDPSGRRSRAQELMFPARVANTTLPGGSFSYAAPHLCLYTEHQIVVFNVQTAEWVQTLNLRKARPLHAEGWMVLAQVMDMSHLVMLTDKGQRECGGWADGSFKKLGEI